MGKGLRSSSESGLGFWHIAGWVFLVAAGAGLALWGFSRGPTAPQANQDEPTATAEAITEPTNTPSLEPTDISSPTPSPTDSPTATLEPTSVPPTATPPPTMLTIGANGVNVRTGPGTNYALLGYLDPQTEVEAIGYYRDWWQIQYEGEEAWIYGDLVAAENTDQVPQVQPPASPTPPPATATLRPTARPTATPAPADYRGVRPDKFEVEGAPGPYAMGQDIWFNMWLTNITSSPIEYEYLGVQVEENGEVQKSWVYSELPPDQQFHWRDRLKGQISSPGTYHLWLVIQFLDGTGYRLLGPVEVIVQ